MSLIRMEANVPPYMSCTGASVNYGTANSGLFQSFANVISSDRITKIDNTSIRIDSAGQYKFSLPIQLRSTTTTVCVGSFQIGINGTYTTFATINGAANIAFTEGNMRHIVTLAAGDVITIRATTSISVANFTTVCVSGAYSGSPEGNINPVGTIVRI